MDLTRPLTRLAGARPHALLAVAPAATRLRLAAERSLRERGWPEAMSPAGADLLVVCGRPGAEFAIVVDELWRQIPQPRNRLEVTDPSELDDLLDQGGGHLRDATSRRLELVRPHALDQRHAPGGAARPDSGGAHGEGVHTDANGAYGGPHAHEQHRDHSDGTLDAGGGKSDPRGEHAAPGNRTRDHGDHSGGGEQSGDDASREHSEAGEHDTPMDAGEHEMRIAAEHEGGDGHGERGGGHVGHGGGGLVAGFALASRAPDRDGLKLDRLHLPLGPVLADWPSGLVVRTVVQGDVIEDAEAFVVDAHDGPAELPFWNEPWLRASAGEQVSEGEAARRRAAALLDSLGRLLAVAGWEEAAIGTRRLRDDLLVGADSGRARPAFSRLDRRLRRSRLLRLQLAGLGTLDHNTALARGVGGPALRAGGDVWLRLRRWLDETADALVTLHSRASLEPPFEGPRGPLGGEPPSRALLDVLPELLIGCELAGARLIVASLDPDSDELVGRPAPVAVHG